MEVDEVSWFSRIKPTCDSKNFDADAQYKRLKSLVDAAKTKAEKDTANANLLRFLRVCVIEPCPPNLKELEVVQRNKTNPRLNDYYNLVCKPFLSNDPAYITTVCDGFPEALSDLPSGITWYKETNTESMVSFLTDNYNKIKAANCRPASVVYPYKCQAVAQAGYLLSRIRTSDLVEEEAQIIIDRLVMLFNIKAITFKDNACNNLNYTLQMLSLSSMAFIGDYLDRINWSKDFLKFYCNVWPKLLN